MNRQPRAAHAMQQCSIALPTTKENDAWEGEQPYTREVKTVVKDLGQHKIENHGNFL